MLNNSTGADFPLRKSTDLTGPDTTSCPECKGSGYVRINENTVTRCQCQRERIIAKQLARLPERYRECSFANFVPIDGAQQRALDEISAEFTKSYLLVGDYGRGKTHLAAAQYNQLTRIERPCLFVGMSELLAELRKEELDPDYVCEAARRARHAEQFHLFVDDLDKFKVTEFKMQALYEIFDALHSRRLGLTATSNFSLRELGFAQRMDGAVQRRIGELCKAVTL